MGMLQDLSSKALHLASRRLSRSGKIKFTAASKDIKASQKAIFQGILANIEQTETGMKYMLSGSTDYTHFRNQVPISDYEDWQALIERQQSGELNVLSSDDCNRYQPTSGSTSAIKWVPYNQAFLNELDQAIGPWMSDLYEQFPGIRKGKHYWSLSWVPSDLRNKLTSSINDDLQLLPWWKRLFMAGTMAVPESISLAKTSEESSFATACYLVASRDLSFISVWSPTFALGLLQLIQKHQSLIASTLKTGHWPLCFPELSYLKAPKSEEGSQVLQNWNGEINAQFTLSLWPELKLISAWDTSSSKIWAEKLKELFCHCSFQGKGLWATEGVISFPYKGYYPLAITSHFYEFEDLNTHEIFASWQLTLGQNVRPIITTGNGLLRYGMKDQLKVTGFINECPCLEFIGRLSGIDMVGEKLSPEVAVEIINEFSIHQAILPISLLALPNSDNDSIPVYALLCEKTLSADMSDGEWANLVIDLEWELEEKLVNNFHYKLARELGQLAHAQVLLREDAMKIYTSHKISNGMVEGNIKIEPLVLWQNKETPQTLQNLTHKLDKHVDNLSATLAAYRNTT